MWTLELDALRVVVGLLVDASWTSWQMSKCSADYPIKYAVSVG